MKPCSRESNNYSGQMFEVHNGWLNNSIIQANEVRSSPSFQCMLTLLAMGGGAIIAQISKIQYVYPFKMDLCQCDFLTFLYWYYK